MPVFREAERRAKQLMRSPSISREVTATKIISGLSASNNSRRSKVQHQQQRRQQRAVRQVTMHLVALALCTAEEDWVTILLHIV